MSEEREKKENGGWRKEDEEGEWDQRGGESEDEGDKRGKEEENEVGTGER